MSELNLEQQIPLQEDLPDVFQYEYIKTDNIDEMNELGKNCWEAIGIFQNGMVLLKRKVLLFKEYSGTDHIKQCSDCSLFEEHGVHNGVTIGICTKNGEYQRNTSECMFVEETDANG